MQEEQGEARMSSLYKGHIYYLLYHGRCSLDCWDIKMKYLKIFLIELNFFEYGNFFL